MLIMHQPTIGKPAFLFFCFCPRDMTNIKIRKNTKVGITFEKKKKKKGRLSVCVNMRFKYDVKISDRNSQN